MKLAVLGLGLMGSAISGRLAGQGHRVLAWNRSARAKDTAASGVEIVASAALAVSGSDCVLLTLSDADAIAAVLFGDETRHALAGKIFIQMGTIAPNESREIGERVAESGGRYLEAPVLGSLPEARNGTLIIMAGGERDLFEECLPVLSELSASPQLVGELGQGAALKLAMNQLIASFTAGFAMSLGLVRAEGVDVDLFMKLLRESALYAPTFDKKLNKYLSHDYANPNFPLKHLLKDIDLFERVAAEADIDQTVAAAMSTLLHRGIESGYGEDDYSALYEVVNPRAD